MNHCIMKAERSERGASMVEMIFLTPILVLFSFNLFDIGRLLINYMEAAHFAQEGVKIGGSTPGLEPGTYEYDGTNCYIPPLTNPLTPCPGNLKHKQVQNMLWKIIRADSDGFGIDPVNSNLIVHTEFDSIAAEVKVELRFDYHGLFQPYTIVSVKTSAVGPYY